MDHDPCVRFKQWIMIRFKQWIMIRVRFKQWNDPLMDHDPCVRFKQWIMILTQSILIMSGDDLNSFKSSSGYCVDMFDF
ncbi:hypothetical protein RRG08_039184 [Elysia crispata]|uniref:Uncharacterized protein n=1 Tax=Elysia crispata TaxID=231223 RepID=A0AAE1DFC6_9GAST|nr:hypothetical protein RRG08_039184 [Elysia crispata]